MSDETKGKRMRGFEDEQAAKFEHKKADAAKQADGDKVVLRARPIQGKIDHAALTREIVARFPKILAALAK